MTCQFRELTDSQWETISYFFDLQRKRNLCLRQVMNAILYLVRSGCQWRNLPTCYPAWSAVYYYFRHWQADGTLQAINEALNSLDRIEKGKPAYPSLLCIDSQSIKLSPLIKEQRGLDAHKKVNGRSHAVAIKRHLLVDTDGRLWSVAVSAADVHDGKCGCRLLKKQWWMERLQKIVGDGGYLGTFAQKVRENGWVFERASRPESDKGFVPLTHRWVVERSISWTNFFRRLAKDYERTTESSAAWLLLANTTVMLQRLPAENKI